MVASRTSTRRSTRLVQAGIVRRLLALTECAYSNSLIEAWWRSLKHQWLFLNALDSVATVRRLVAFYVGQHNGVIPHAALRRRTPEEMYFGTAASGASEMPSRLASRPSGATAGQPCRVLSGVSRSPGFRGPARPGVNRRVARGENSCEKLPDVAGTSPDQNILTTRVS